MKCQVLISRKNKNNITNLPSAESAHSMVSVKIHVLFCYGYILCILELFLCKKYHQIY